VGAAGQGRGSLSGRKPEAQPSRALSEYPEAMNESSSRSFGRTVVAGLVLLVAAWLLLHFVIGIVTAIASVLVVVVAVVALIWALRVLL
jgi:preprotein translocase subunit SecF